MLGELKSKVSTNDDIGVYSPKRFLRKKDPADTGYKWEYDGEHAPFLRRCLKWVDVLSYGLSGSFGAGVYVIAGAVAANYAGPSVIISFLLAGFACMITAFCYSEFSERIHISGSAYTYVYVAFGELFGWLAGCLMTVEYVMSAAAVAQGTTNSWHSAARIIGVKIPPQLLQIEAGHAFYIYPFAAMLVIFCSFALFISVKESARFYKVITLLNVIILGLTCVAGCFYIDKKNWSNFIPYGTKGIFLGASKVFFAYVGFDTCTVLAGEVKDPNKTMAKGVIGNLSVSMFLYIFSAVVLTGMVPYTQLISNGNELPFAFAFSEHSDSELIPGLVVVGSLMSMLATTVCCLLGQPRIFYQMAKDGLLSEKFAQLNTKSVPIFGAFVTVAIGFILAFLFDLGALGDAISCGALIIFSAVQMGILSLRKIDAGETISRKHVAMYIATIWSCVFVGLCISTEAPYWVLGVSLGSFVVCVVIWYILFYYRKNQRNVDPSLAPSSFRCPMVPLLPCVGCLCNIVMIVQLGWKPIVMIAGAGVIALAGYFFYGIKHSRLNFVRLSDEYYY